MANHNGVTGDTELGKKITFSDLSDRSKRVFEIFKTYSNVKLNFKSNGAIFRPPR